MAEGRYTRIKSRFWDDEKVTKWDDSTRLLALYLLTSPHNNILGCFMLRKLYICADLNWEPEALAKPFTKLLDDDFFQYDESNSLVLLNNYLKHNPLENGNQVLAAIKQLDELPRSPLFGHLKQLLEPLAKPFMEPLLERLSERYANPVTVTVTVTTTVTNNICTHHDGAVELGDLEPDLENISKSKVEEYPVEFEEFWQVYPRKKEKGAAYRCWRTRKREGHLPRDMLAAAAVYREECTKLGTQEQFIKQPKTFLGPGKPFQEYLNRPDERCSKYEEDDYDRTSKYV